MWCDLLYCVWRLFTRKKPFFFCFLLVYGYRVQALCGWKEFGIDSAFIMSIDLRSLFLNHFLSQSKIVYLYARLLSLRSFLYSSYRLQFRDAVVKFSTPMCFGSGTIDVEDRSDRLRPICSLILKSRRMNNCSKRTGVRPLRAA